MKFINDRHKYKKSVMHVEYISGTFLITFIMIENMNDPTIILSIL